VYTATDTNGSEPLLGRLPLEREVKLKPGLQVMIRWNVDPKNGLANGTLGIVKECNLDSVTITLADEREVSLSRVRVDITNWVTGDILASREQLPLCAAESMTVHKVQSCTVGDNVRVFLDFGQWGFFWGSSLADQRMLLITGLTRVTDHAQILLAIGKLNGSEVAQRGRLRKIFNSNLEDRRRLLTEVRARDLLATMQEDNV